MIDSVMLEHPVERHSEFDLKRVALAQAQGFEIPVTGYLCRALITARAGIGVVFGHVRKDRYGRFADGHLIRTSDVRKAEREGRYWVLTTENSRYVLATFDREHGRASLREFLRLFEGQHHSTPRRLQ